MSRKKQERNDFQHGSETFVGRKNAGRFEFRLGGVRKNAVVRLVEGEPEWNEAQNCWTVPHGFFHPTCPTCDHRYYEQKPQRSIGGASVHGAMCARCLRELETL